MTAANDIKTAVGMLDATDWVDGKPSLVALKRLTRDDTLTAKAVADAMAPASADSGAPANKETGPAPVVVAPPAAIAAEPATQPDGEPDRLAVMLQEAAQLRAARDVVAPKLTELEVAKAKIEAEIALHSAKIDALDVAIEERTVELTHAQTVKRIQKQTQDGLQAAADRATAAAAAFGVRPQRYASPLDAALAGGAKRSVVLINGKAHMAPPPRSPEGVRNMANWIHSRGARSQV